LSGLYGRGALTHQESRHARARISVPGSHAVIFVPRRRVGSIDVLTTLPLRSYRGVRHQWVRLTIRREELGRILQQGLPYTRIHRLAGKITASLLAAGRRRPVTPGPSERDLTSGVFSAVIARGRYTGVHFEVTVHAVAVENSDAWLEEFHRLLSTQNRYELFWAVRQHLVPDVLAHVVKGKRPRGRQRDVGFLIELAKRALVMAVGLVRKSEHDAVLRAVIEKAVKGRPYRARGHRDPAIRLVSRALEGAWERFGITRLDERLARDRRQRDEIFSKLYRPKDRRELERRRKREGDYALLRGLSPLGTGMSAEDAWEFWLLAPQPGQLAQDCGLVPSPEPTEAELGQITWYRSPEPASGFALASDCLGREPDKSHDGL
jgi:hypothetical protein